MLTMKTLAALLIAAATTLAAQDSTSTATFTVQGNCKQCEKRIERAFLLDERVTEADWIKETKKLTVRYRSGSATERELHEIAAKAGHSTDSVQATANTYKALPKCCRYNDVGSH